MPTWLKVVLALVGVMVLLCGLSSAGAYFWFNENKDKLKGVGERAKKEGSAFAYQHDSNECVDEALRRLGERNGIVDQAEHKLFLKACLGKAARPAGFCEGVPPRSEIMLSATWAVERCVAKGRAQDQDCARMMQAVQEACQTPG
ncbi:MAG: hypothetical protein Q8L48_13745 [Archangium sp.]|nr:hypothetical protein [Archangium sp.]